MRAVFVIHPAQVLWAMIYYPLTTERNMDEIVRLIDALQTNTETGLATPANWHPSGQYIVPRPPPKMLPTNGRARATRLSTGTLRKTDKP